MDGKCIQYNGSTGIIVWSAEDDMHYRFESSEVTGDLTEGDLVSFSVNGLHGVDTRAVSITKRN